MDTRASKFKKTHTHTDTHYTTLLRLILTTQQNPS